MSAALAMIAAVVVVPCIGDSQTAISAKAGMINHIEGRVLLQDEPLLDHPGRFLHVEPGQSLRTEGGRAEVLFALGSYLRLAEDSEIEMAHAGLTSARVRLHRGSMIVEPDLVFDDDSLTVLVGGAEIRLLTKGLYRLNVTEQGGATLQVMNGNAVILSRGAEHPLKKKQMAHIGTLGDVLSVTDFKQSDHDELENWNAQRSAVVERETAKAKQPKGPESRIGLLDALPNRARAGIPSP